MVFLRHRTGYRMINSYLNPRMEKKTTRTLNARPFFRLRIFALLYHISFSSQKGKKIGNGLYNFRMILEISEVKWCEVWFRADGSTCTMNTIWVRFVSLRQRHNSCFLVLRWVFCETFEIGKGHFILGNDFLHIWIDIMYSDIPSYLVQHGANSGNAFVGALKRIE